jgi:hypothetical protein
VVVAAVEGTLELCRCGALGGSSEARVELSFCGVGTKTRVRVRESPHSFHNTTSADCRERVAPQA